MNEAGNNNDSCAEAVPCTIYMVYGAGRVKIGRTTDLKARFEALRSMSPVALTEIWSRTAPPELENELHQRFCQDRLHGEWFRISPEIRAFLRGQDFFNRKRGVSSEKLLLHCERQWIEALNEHQRGWNGCLAHVRNMLSEIIALEIPQPQSQRPLPVDLPPRPPALPPTDDEAQALARRLGLGLHAADLQ